MKTFAARHLCTDLFIYTGIFTHIRVTFSHNQTVKNSTSLILISSSAHVCSCTKAWQKGFLLRGVWNDTRCTPATKQQCSLSVALSSHYFCFETKMETSTPKIQKHCNIPALRLVAGCSEKPLEESSLSLMVRTLSFLFFG